MTNPIQHHKMIVKNPSATTIPRTGYDSYVYSRRIKFFSDPYFQQLWLNLLLKHKETFVEISNRLGKLFCIPICDAHELIEQEQANLYKMIKELECNEITVNLLATNFKKFKYKNKDLNDLLNKAKNIQLIRDNLYQKICRNPYKIKPNNLEETIEAIEKETQNQEQPFKAPDKLIQKNRILQNLEIRTNNKKLTFKAYNIIRSIIFENIELLDDFFNHIENKHVSYENRPQYLTLCEQYGKAEMAYLLNQYLRD